MSKCEKLKWAAFHLFVILSILAFCVFFSWLAVDSWVRKACSYLTCHIPTNTVCFSLAISIKCQSVNIILRWWPDWVYSFHWSPCFFCRNLICADEPHQQSSLVPPIDSDMLILVRTECRWNRYSRKLTTAIVPDFMQSPNIVSHESHQWPKRNTHYLAPCDYSIAICLITFDGRFLPLPNVSWRVNVRSEIVHILNK